MKRHLQNDSKTEYAKTTSNCSTFTKAELDALASLQTVDSTTCKISIGDFNNSATSAIKPGEIMIDNSTRKHVYRN